MSYIFDALKKMDHEKSRKAEFPGMTMISGDLFQEPRKFSAKGNVWKIAFFVLITVFISTVVLGTFFIRRAKRAKSDDAVVSAEKLSPVVSSSPPYATREKIANADQPSPRVLAPDFPARKAEETSRRGAAFSGDESPAETTFDLTPDKMKEMARAARVERAAQVEQAAPVAQTEPPMEITVSGVAWQDERKARRAVVNGLLAREGSVVAGARISEIMKDRVRFSRAGATFDVIMNTAGDNPSAGTGAVLQDN